MDKEMSSMKPRYIKSGSELEKLRAEKAPMLVDIYREQCIELSRVENPATTSPEPGSTANDAWVYFGWSNTLLHCLGPTELRKLRTNRNRELISTEEQEKLGKFSVGVAGMSVGAGMAISLVHGGISNVIKIADFDQIDTTNLNRLRATLLDVGRPKVNIAAQHIYQLDPFVEVELYAEGLNEDNITDFFLSPKIDLVIDEIDDFRMKLRLRQEAKRHKIPLLMFTSLGDNILVDVERYDLDSEQRPFNGLLGDFEDELLAKEEVTQEEIKRYSVLLVGAEYIPTKALKSVSEMGKTLVGRPQLYSTIAVDGGIASYVVRQIALTGAPRAGRYFIKFGDLFDLETEDLKTTPDREGILSKLGG